MELEDIPLEQFQDFCESLDTRELAKLAQTNRENYLICEKILSGRKTKLGDQLFRELIGKWYSPPNEFGFIDYTKITPITSSGKEFIKVSSSDFNITSGLVYKNNISTLRSLLRYLQNKGNVRYAG